MTTPDPFPNELVEYRVVGAGGQTVVQIRDADAAERLRLALDGPNSVSDDKPHRVQVRTVTVSEWEDARDERT